MNADIIKTLELARVISKRKPIYSLDYAILKACLKRKTSFGETMIVLRSMGMELYARCDIYDGFLDYAILYVSEEIEALEK